MRGARVSRFFILSSAALTGLALLSVETACAQISSREGIELQNQIQQLNAQLQQVQANTGAVSSSATVPSVSGPSGDLVSQLLQRVATLENDNRDMRGQLDQLTNEMQTQTANLSKQIGDMQFAAQNGSRSGTTTSLAGSSAAAATGTRAATAGKSATALELLKAGQVALKGHDYATAQNNAEQAVKLAKTANGRLESQFLLAQSLAGQKQYRNSAVAYFDAYNRAPKSPRAPEALLGVSASMLALGDKNSACQALGKLESEFSNPSPAVKAALVRFKGRASCQ